jgi:hypothetical protein
MKFAKYTYLISGIYGLVVLLPQFFLEDRIGQDQPPPITHPEFFYGFICVTVSFQLVFLTISRDPLRYRPLMLVSLVEKLPFVMAVGCLYFQTRVGRSMVAAALIDAFWGLMFLVSYLKTRSVQTTS